MKDLNCSICVETRENMRKYLEIDNINSMEILLRNTNIVMIFYYKKLIEYLSHINNNIEYYLTCNEFFINTTAKIKHPNIICTKIKHLNSLNLNNSTQNIIFDSIVKTHDILKITSEKGVKSHMVYNFSSALFINTNSPKSNIIIRICGNNEIGIEPSMLLLNIYKLKNVRGICVDMNNNNMNEVIMFLQYAIMINITDLYLLNIDVNNINEYKITKLGFNINLIVSENNYEKYTEVYSKITAKKTVIQDIKSHIYYMCDMSIVKQDKNKTIVDENIVNETLSYVCDSISLNNVHQIKCNNVNEGDFIRLKNISLNLFNKNKAIIWTK